MPKKKILCAESYKDTAQAVKVLLDIAGFDVEIVHSGVDALQKAKEGFHLCLMDVILPDMTGWDLFVKLKEKFPDEKYIFYGNFDLPGRIKEMLFDNGVHDYLLKPFEKKEFLDKIHSVLL